MQVFLEADMRCQHDGLAELARKKKVDVYTLKPGQHVMFLNKALNRIKMFSSGGVLSYLRLDKGKVDLETIHTIPKAFEGNMGLAYRGALRKTLEKKLSPRVH